MAAKTTSTALQTAMQGGKVSDKAAQSALSQAVGRIANLTKKANTSKEAMMETGTLVLHTAETQGSLFLASMAEGYLGDDRMKLGSVDVRAPMGLIATGYGLYQTMTGQKGAGSHVLAIGNGVIGSWLASAARNAGRTLAERRAPAPAPTAAPAPVVALQGAPMLPPLLPEPGLAGPMREVLLTPEATEGEVVGAGRGVRRRVRQHMRQRRAALEGDEVLGDDDFGDEDEEAPRGGRRRQMRRRMRRRIRARMERRFQARQGEEGSLEGDDFGDEDFADDTPRGRFVRADDT